jgi:hypothetical protein
VSSAGTRRVEANQTSNLALRLMGILYAINWPFRYDGQQGICQTECVLCQIRYAIVNSRSRPEKGSFKFGCDCGHKYRPPKHLDSRQTATGWVGCPFKLTGRRIAGQWMIKVKNQAHIHSFLENNGAHEVHPMLRIRALNASILNTISKTDCKDFVPYQRQMVCIVLKGTKILSYSGSSKNSNSSIFSS